MKAPILADSYPLSPLQRGMLLQSLYAPRSGVEVWQLVGCLHEALDVACFHGAWQGLVDRYAVLRTAFRWEGLEQPVQDVYRDVEVPFEAQDWRELPADEQEVRLEGYLRDDRRRGFQLGRPPLLRVAVFRCAEEEHRFVFTVHHAVVDGRSGPLILRAVFDRYEALCQGQAPELPPPPEFRAYIERLEQQELGAAERFWRRALAGFEVPTPLPGKAPSRAKAGETGHAELETRVPVASTQALLALGERAGFSLNTLVQGAWALVLSRASGEDDVVFGAIKSCRVGLPGGESMVGPLINTVPVRVRIPAEAPLIPWLRQIREDWTAIRDHEHTPLSLVQEWSDVSAGRALCESLLIFERYNWLSALTAAGGKWERRSFWLRRQPDFPLTVYAFQEPALQLRIIYDRQRFAAETIARLLEHLRTALVSIAASPENEVRALDVVPEAERWLMVGEWNDTGAALGEGECLHDLVARQAVRTPERVAATWEGRELTYGELARRARSLASQLSRLGVEPDVRVGVFMERGLDLPVALLGILTAGGAYVPLDPAYPDERTAGMLEDSSAAIVLTQASLAPRLAAAARTVVCLDRLESPEEAGAPGPPSRAAGPGNLAYLIYTSGSTGRPKAVAVTHRSAVALVHWASELFTAEELAGVLASTSACFDLSIFELFVPLACGGRFLLVSSVLRLPVMAAASQVTLVNTVPSAMAECLRMGALPPGLRAINLAGEALTRDLADRLLERCPGLRLFDLYGPSEDTTYSTWCPRRKGEAASIGRPISGTRVYLLDNRLRPVPLGAVGELYLAGGGLARGYWGRPERTAEGFLPDPFHGEWGGRLYRTGDLARHLPDGSLELLGRVDRQIKIRGYRVEPGEVEAALRRSSAVGDAAVLVREDDPGERRLVAYVVPAAGGRPATGELLAYLKGQLPHYLVPAAVVLLDMLPRMPSGKLDARVLPRPDLRRSEGEASYVPPGSALEKTIAQVWQEVLRVDRVGLNDNFFDLGGHSLALARVYERLSSVLDQDLAQVELFEFPTVSALARRLVREQGDEWDAETVEERAEAQRAAVEGHARRRLEPSHG